MVVLNSAIKAFLDRPLDNFEQLKTASDEWINVRLSELRPQPTFHTEMLRHQKISFLISVALGQFLFFIDMGGGKTKLFLDTLAYKIKKGEAKRGLVLVQTSSLVEGWLDQIEQHRPDLTRSILNPQMTSEQKSEALFDSDTNIVVVTYQGFTSLICDSVQAKKGKKLEWVINEKAINRVSEVFQVIGYDESTVLKNHQSLYFKAAKKLSKKISDRFGYTGSPVGKDPTPLWSQFYAIDRGETLGETLGMFRAAFFDEKDNYWSKWGKEYKFKTEMTAQLHRVMGNRSIIFSSAEFADLPEQSFMTRYITFSDEARAYNEKLMKVIREAYGDLNQIDTAYHNMRQVCSGYVSFNDDQGQRRVIDFPVNPKLDAMLDDLDLVDPEQKVVIFNEYIHTGELIGEALKKRKIMFSRLWSGTKNKRKELDRFNLSPKCRVMLVNNQAGALGLNLQVANHVFHFETTPDPITRRQADKRCHRIGQTKHVFYRDYVVRGSVDIKIMKSLQEGRNFHAALMSGDETL